MDAHGNIYEVPEGEEFPKEDLTRLDGYLRGRAEAAKLSGARKDEKLVFDSSRGKTYRKESEMGIENIDDLKDSDQSDPGDEQTPEPTPQPSPEPISEPQTESE